MCHSSPCNRSRVRNGVVAFQCCPGDFCRIFRCGLEGGDFREGSLGRVIWTTPPPFSSLIRAGDVEILIDALSDGAGEAGCRVRGGMLGFRGAVVCRLSF